MALQTPFPNPPPFYRSFTAANRARLAELEQHAANSGRTLRSSDLPEELQHLRPPSPPTGAFITFGEERTLEAPRPIVPIDERVLFPPPPTTSSTESRTPQASPEALLTLTRSILLSYLELLHVLVANPAGSEYGPKWEDLRDLFRNAHVMINSYRGWQGREALIMLLEAQLRVVREGEAAWDVVEASVHGTLQRLGALEGRGFESSIEGGGAGIREIADQKETEAVETVDERRRMWALLEASGG